MVASGKFVRNSASNGVANKVSPMPASDMISIFISQPQLDARQFRGRFMQKVAESSNQKTHHLERSRADDFN